jgi:hypothetical protein
MYVDDADGLDGDKVLLEMRERNQIHGHKHVFEKTNVLISRINKDKGLKIVYPKSNELFIDIDTEKQWLDFQERMNVYIDHFGNDHTYKLYPSSSGLPHRHIVVTLPFGIDDIMRIALQAILGSSPSRECMSIYKILDDDIQHPTLFIEKVF